MNPEAGLFKQKKQVVIKSTTILLIALATAFFSRGLQSLKVPSLVNFLHFAIVPLACGIALFNTRTKDSRQIFLTQEILFSLLLFLTIITSSALVNQVGIINIILSFLLWTEPFMFILALTSLPLSAASLKNFRTGVISFNLFHLLVAFIQGLALGLVVDDMQGVFYRSGSGHVVASSVSLSFGLYYFTSIKTRRRWLAALILAASAVHLVMADAKQVVVTFAFAFAIFSISKLQDPVKAIIYTIGLIVFCITFWWGVQNLEVLSNFLAWNRPELYGPDGEAKQFKLLAINLAITKFHSSWNWLLGLGPGQYCDRLGQMLGEYKQLLLPLGATISPSSTEIWTLTIEHWLGPVKGSSFFAPTFGWAAIWADFGFLGLFSYLYLGFILWSKICKDDDMSKILLLSASAHGLIFTQMQEPGYMLSIAAFIALRWQEKQVQL